MSEEQPNTASPDELPETAVILPAGSAPPVGETLAAIALLIGELGLYPGLSPASVLASLKYPAVLAKQLQLALEREKAIPPNRFYVLTISQAGAELQDCDTEAEFDEIMAAKIKAYRNEEVSIYAFEGCRHTFSTPREIIGIKSDRDDAEIRQVVLKKESNNPTGSVSGHLQDDY